MEEQDLKFSEFIERYLEVCSMSEKYRIENILKDMGYSLSKGKIVKISNNKNYEAKQV